MDGLSWVGQDSFAAGAFPLQERVPRTAVEDLVNGLVDDDGSVFKRGGGAYKGNALPQSIVSLWDLQLAVGQRTLARLSNQTLYVYASDDTSVVQVAPFAPSSAGRRLAVVGGVAAIPVVTGGGVGNVYLYGGARGSNTSYITGTVSVTEGGTTVTGSGTSWLTNIDPGMILYIATVGTGVVRSVDSDTQITLTAPWIGSTVSGSGDLFIEVLPGVATPALGNFTTLPKVGAAGNRLLVGVAGLLTFSAIGDPTTCAATDYHSIPNGGSILGIQGLGSGAMVFTTLGIYELSNIAYDLTDALGNVQQSLALQAPDVVLWDECGLAGVDGGVLIPALDDLYTYSGGAVQKFNALGLRKMWRQYVKAGYTLGNAAVHRGHYFLPILNGTTFVDLVVLKLSTGAWARWSGHSAGVSFAQRGATSSAGPKLLAAQSTRILDLTGTFEPAAANKNEADGSTHTFTATFRTVQRPTPGETLRKVRVRYELDDAAADNPTIAAAVAVGRPGSAFTTLTGSGPENVGQTPKVWSKVNRTGSEFRLRLTSVGPSASLVLRSVELAFRPTGAQ